MKNRIVKVIPYYCLICCKLGTDFYDENGSWEKTLKRCEKGHKR